MDNTKEKQQLERWYKVYAIYKDTPFIGFIEEYLEELLRQVCHVYVKINNFKHDENYLDYYTLEETLDLSKKFLSTIDEDYPNYLNQGLINGFIDIYDKDDYYEYDSEGNFIDVEKEGPYYETRDISEMHRVKTISLPLKHNIDDVYSLIHELFHSISASASYHVSNDFKVLTESVSITYEFILYDYLKENGICSKDRIKPIEFRINDLRKKTETLAIGMDILKKVKENIDDLKNIKVCYIPAAKDETKEEKLERERKIKNERETIGKDYFKLRKVLEYYLGTLIAVINYKRYKEGKLDIETIEEYTYSIKNNEELESLNILFDKFPSLKEVQDSLDFILNEINNSKSIVKK